MKKEELEKKYQTSIERGLTDLEATKRLNRDGPNELKSEKKEVAIVRFFLQFNDVLIYILLASGIISCILKEFSDALIILLVVLINGITGFIQEEKATKSLEALKRITTRYATVKRDNKIKEIPASELVVGDIIILEEGKAVPADALIFNNHEILLDESALTGESEPVHKDEFMSSKDNTPLAEKKDHVFMSTLVLQGHSEAIVINTGMNSEIGHIADLLEDNKKIETPLQKKLKDLGKLLGVITLIICLLLFVIALIQKRNVVEMFITSISLAVAAVPEGLPAVVTIVLAMGVQRLVKVNMVIRKLHAVETLGAVSKVLTDKTGTLTQNKMTVAKINYNLNNVSLRDIKEDESIRKMSECMASCNNASIAIEEIGDPTEIALLKFAKLFHINSNKERINERAFTSDSQMMSVLVRRDGQKIQYTKGAYEKIIARCNRFFFENKILTIDQKTRIKLDRLMEEMSKEAMRVLAFAYKESKDIEESNMIFLGFVGMIDPPKSGVKDAIGELKSAGVDTIMITGDNLNTAFAIAKKLRIADKKEQCIEGKELDKLSKDQLASSILNKKVFARVTPKNKIQIVEAFQSHNYLVAMTGDGVNDAPSLRKADVGIAMGKNGTDVAKNAADMILIDDNYSSIVKAIKEGRGIYTNIKKTALFLLSSNFAEVMAMLIGIILALPMPLVAVHILWINLITDSLPAIALGVDKTSEDIMKEKPRDKNESLFAKGGYSLLFFYGGLITLITLISFLIVPITYVINLYGFDKEFLYHIKFVLENNNSILLKARTFAFTTLGMSQLFHMIGMSDIKKYIFKILKKHNFVLLVSFILGIVLQIIVTEIPMLTEMFKTSSLSLKEWIFLMILSAFPLIMHEIMVPVFRKY